MKYCIIGAGGTGGCMGAYMTRAGKDVTIIARGAHLEAMEKNGIAMDTTKDGSYVVKPVKVSDMEHYKENPDVIFVCVKGYSLDATYDFIKRVAHKCTVVIPILNIFGTGKEMAKHLPELLVTDGCIYIVGQIKAPGELVMKGDIFRVVYGVRESSEYRPVLMDIKKDLEESGIEAIVSENIRRDALLKFSYVSPAAACGQFYDLTAERMQKDGEERETFIRLIKEIDLLAKALKIPFEEDIVARNLDILAGLAPSADTSMQRDVKKGGASEIDGLIHGVVRMGEEAGVELPTYRMISEEMKKRGL